MLVLGECLVIGLKLILHNCEGVGVIGCIRDGNMCTCVCLWVNVPVCVYVCVSLHVHEWCVCVCVQCHVCVGHVCVCTSA